jgi:hypothetical protein
LGSVQRYFNHLIHLAFADGIKLAGFVAGAAFYAFVLIYHMRLFHCPGYALRRALARASCAADALFRYYLIAQQGCANTGGAALFLDVRQIFVFEVAEGCEHRIWPRLAEAAERSFVDVHGKFLQTVDIFQNPFAFRDAGKYFQHAPGANAAESAFPTGFILDEAHEEMSDLNHATGVIHHNQTTGTNHGPRES